jgi:predicted TIM-barrel fold metal-dependent hydrolase
MVSRILTGRRSRRRACANGSAPMTRPSFTDTHVHFYDRSHPSLRWDWLLPEAEDPELGDYSAIKAQRYVAEDFLAETRFAGVGNVVHVQAAIGSDDPVEETRWLDASAERTGAPHGIVGYCDFAAPGAAEVLRGHVEASRRVCGIRDLRYDDYLTDERWCTAAASLAQLGLVLCDDPLVEAMPDLARLAAANPELTICIDHAGFPHERTREYFERWREGMRTLAACPNTVVKISGLGMADHAWTVDSLRDWVLACIDLWGTERSFFGSNWPVDRLYSGYGDVVAAYWELIADCSAEEQARLFHGNADRIFGLG